MKTTLKHIASIQTGVFSKEEKTTGSKNTPYYIRKSGQIINSKLDFLNGAFGKRKAKRIQVDEFLKIRLILPSLEKQTATALVLQAAGKEIAFFKAKTKNFARTEKGRDAGVVNRKTAKSG